MAPAASSDARVLLMAYMFPPIMDAGAFRPAAFARYLPEFGYSVSVLTRSDYAGLPVDPAQLARLPAAVRIDRVENGFLDGWQAHYRRKLRWLEPVELMLGRHRGTIAEAIAWRVAARDEHRVWEVSWLAPAVKTGLAIIERDRPDVILASAPPYETFKAAWTLHTRAGIPLVVDYRDPWTYGLLWNPGSRSRAKSEQAWERRVVDAAAKILVVTPSMKEGMINAYPEHRGKVELLMNGYEEYPERTSFTPPPDRFVLRFIGSIMERRFPDVLFEAVRRLRSTHPDLATDLRVEFIGPNQSAMSLNDRLREANVADLIEYVGPVAHDKARELMRTAHVLLHIETSATYAVSSKLFEYFAAGRPIVGILPSGSDDEWFLHQSGVGKNAGTDNAQEIADVIHRLWCNWRNGTPAVHLDETWLRQFHRREQTRTLSRILDSLLMKPDQGITAGGRNRLESRVQ